MLLSDHTCYYLYRMLKQCVYNMIQNCIYYYLGCGVSVAKQQGAQRRIVGGDEAGFGSFPWQVTGEQY